MKDNRTRILTAEIDGERIDSFLFRILSDDLKLSISRSRIQKLILDGLVLVDNKLCKKNYILSAGDKVSIEIPEDKPTEVQPETIPFEILFQDDDIIIINKPAGVITHPTETMPTGTLINGLIGQDIKLAPAGGKFRPGIVHRLDRETSGIILLAKTDAAYHRLIETFRKRRIDKFYQAIVIGNMRDLKGTFDLDIGRNPANRTKMAAMKSGGREARTDYTVLERFMGFDFLELQIFTGRTHQIRVHLSHSGRSVLNDSVYGTKKLTDHIRWLGMKGLSADRIGKLMSVIKSVVEYYPGMFLHAEKLVFYHPITLEKVEFSAPLPEEFTKLLNLLRIHAKEDFS